MNYAEVRTRSAYSSVAIALHWLIALLVLGNIAGGLWMGELFASDDPADRALGGTIVTIHKSTGITILALSLFRFGWRLAHGFPRLPGHTPVWQRILARGTHATFYALMIATPLVGWSLVSASPRNSPIDWYGLFPIPQLPIPDSRATAGWLSNLHEILALSFLAVLALHVAGALKHHLIDRDDVLARMLPLVRRPAPR